jgi:hypothetical protein
MVDGEEEDGPTVLKGVVVSESGHVKVWSTIGIKVPIPDLPGGEFSFEFGHERYAKSSSNEEIAKAARLADEFNELELERRFTKLLRQIRRNGQESIEEAKKPIPDKEVGRLDRIRAAAEGTSKSKKGKKK